VSYTIINLTEKAIRAAITNSLYPVEAPVFISDENGVKPEMPYIVVHVEEAVEQEGPGTGIFKMPVEIIFRDHVKAQSPDFRDAVLVAIENVQFGSPLKALTQAIDGFYCYGFGMTQASMQVNTELKAYESIRRWEITAIPRSWPQGPNAQPPTPDGVQATFPVRS
jgi:hypothetical protein